MNSPLPRMRLRPVLHLQVLFAGLLGLAAPPLAAAQAPEPVPAAVAPFSAEHERAVERIIALATEDSQVATWLLTLTKGIGPRLTASPGLDQAYEWSLAQFRAFGLDAHLETYDEWPLGFERGPSYGRIVGTSAAPEVDGESGPRQDGDGAGGAGIDEDEDLVFMTGAWTRGTDGPVRGRALLVPRDMDQLEACKDALDGAWLVEGPRKRIADREERSKFNEAYSEARKASPPAGRITASRAGELLKMGGRPAQSIEEAMQRELRVTLVVEQHKALVERLQAGEELELEFSIDNRFLPGPRPLRNVVADLVGSEYPSEYVIVQSHLDSWDLAEGAADNGTGCATTMEAARLLTASGARPKRTIRFILYSGEEQGLHGSKAYVEEHADELEAVSMVLNHDHGTNHLKGILSTEFMRPQLERVFGPVMELDPERPFNLIPVGNFPKSGSSDHASFVKVGVPAIHWAQDEAGYYTIHHTQHDTFERADQDEQRHSSMVIAISALGFANLDHLVDRTDLIAPPPRKMGVSLSRGRGTTVESVTPGGIAAQAGWQADDKILEIDGKAVTSRARVISAVQDGEPRKLFVLERGEERIETTLDWTDDPGEAARDRAKERKAAREEEAGGGGMLP